MREEFRRELKELKAEVLSIGQAVTDMTSDAVASLVNGDVDLAQKVIDNDAEIDRRCLGVEEHSLEVTATQFPVSG